MKYYIFDFFKNLSVNDKINFKVEYINIGKHNASFIFYLLKSQSLINRYRKKTVL
jgi:hypothetical protein